MAVYSTARARQEHKDDFFLGLPLCPNFTTFERQGRHISISSAGLTDSWTLLPGGEGAGKWVREPWA